MRLFSELRIRAKHVFWPFCWIALVVYLSFHMIQGDRGLIAYWQIRTNIEDARRIYNDELSLKLKLQNKVNLMRSTSLDRDILEEQARYLLGYSKEDEVIIFLKN